MNVDEYDYSSTIAEQTLKVLRSNAHGTPYKAMVHPFSLRRCVASVSYRIEFYTRPIREKALIFVSRIVGYRLRTAYLTEVGELIEGGTIIMKEVWPDRFVRSSVEGDCWIGMLGWYTEEWMREYVAADNEERRLSYHRGLADGYNTGHAEFKIE